MLSQMQRLNDELLLRLQKALQQNRELRSQLKEERKGEEIDDEWDERDDELSKLHPGWRYLKPYHRVISKIDHRHPRLFETLLEAKTAEEEAKTEAEAAPTPYTIRDVSAAEELLNYCREELKNQERLDEHRLLASSPPHPGATVSRGVQTTPDYSLISTATQTPMNPRKQSRSAQTPNPKPMHFQSTQTPNPNPMHSRSTQTSSPNPMCSRSTQTSPVDSFSRRITAELPDADLGGKTYVDHSPLVAHDEHPILRCNFFRPPAHRQINDPH